MPPLSAKCEEVINLVADYIENQHTKESVWIKASDILSFHSLPQNPGMRKRITTTLKEIKIYQNSRALPFRICDADKHMRLGQKGTVHEFLIALNN